MEADPRLELFEALQERDRRISRNRLATYKPYEKQMEFHAAGANKRERLFMAGNQLGKTLAGGAETAMHLTGRYPEWWAGRRFDSSIVGWAAGVSNEGVRDGCQRILLGRVEEIGTGWIPGDSIVDYSKKRGIEGSIDFVSVRHVSGKISYLHFKSYDQGREKFQAETLNWFWCDEEPPEDIYMEGITRTNATNGPIIVTFTPLLGLSRVVKRFLNEPSPDRHVTRMTIDDAPHYSAEQRKRIKDSYPDHERDARTEGIPILGSGVVFPVAMSFIRIDPIPIPRHWCFIGGMDFGYDHPFAAAEHAWDRDTDTVYVTREFRHSKQTPIQHAMVIKEWDPEMVWAWPHDGLHHSKDSGVELHRQYQKAGLKLTAQRATYSDGTAGVEAGVLDMLQRMQLGKWKVFSTCPQWLDEMAIYHRDDGKVVKIDDDLISASRYATMMLRHARVRSTWRGRPRTRPAIAAGTNEVADYV